MRIPYTICKNTIDAYRVPDLVYLRKEKIKCDDFFWDEFRLKTLREWCIHAIQKHWQAHPFYKEIALSKDRDLLLQTLSCDLPLELTVPIIEDDYYWERCFKHRWPNAPEPHRRVKKLKEYSSIPIKAEVVEVASTENTSVVSGAPRYDPSMTFCSKYIQDQQQIKSIQMRQVGLSTFHYVFPSVANLTTSYSRYSEDFYNAYSTTDFDTVSSSNVIEVEDEDKDIPNCKTWKECFLERHMQEELERMKPEHFNREYIQDLVDLCKEYVYSLKITSLKAAIENEEECIYRSDHISLDVAIAGLPKLYDISICYNEAHHGDNFSWDKMKVTDRDCKLLAQGLVDSNVKIFRILRSDIDGPKLKRFIRPLVDNTSLRLLDLSHCKIGDDGALAISGALLNHTHLETLILVNNRIGPKGAEGLAYYLKTLTTKAGLANLNMRLNNIGVEGGNCFGTALARGSPSLRQLGLSACGLTKENINITKVFMFNNTLEKLDLSSNDLGPDFENVIVDDISKNSTVIHLDLRMCNISPKVRAEVDEILRRNWVKRRGPIERPSFTYEMPYHMF